MTAMPDFGLLLLRVSSGLMMIGHGIGKASDLIDGNDGFPDPLFRNLLIHAYTPTA